MSAFQGLSKKDSHVLWIGKQQTTTKTQKTKPMQVRVLPES